MSTAINITLGAVSWDRELIFGRYSHLISLKENWDDLHPVSLSRLAAPVKHGMTMTTTHQTIPWMHPWGRGSLLHLQHFLIINLKQHKMNCRWDNWEYNILMHWHIYLRSPRIKSLLLFFFIKSVFSELSELDSIDVIWLVLQKHHILIAMFECWISGSKYHM